MRGTLFGASGAGFRGWATGALLSLAACAATSAAETGPATAPPALVGAGDVDGAVVPASCASCSGGLLGQPPADVVDAGGCAGCGCGNGCVPGREPCDCCCDACDGPGRFLCGIYQCICCPDHCYEPHWEALADAAFFQTGGPRPITQLRLRYQRGWDMPFPDKAEFFMPRADSAPGAKGPRQVDPVILDSNKLDYREFHLYNEAAIGRFSAWIDLPYRNIDKDQGQYNGGSGFGDLSFGTKSLLLDCELIQLSFEFNVFTPTGDFLKGLGTGHVSLEPGLLTALKLTSETYLQNEIAYRFPLGGDQSFQGPVFHYHLSLNQRLCHCGHDIQVIGTAELNGWEFEGGQYTGFGNDPAAKFFADVALSSHPAADVLNVGPGIRLVICDKIDFGVAGYFNLSSGSVADEFLQAEFRWRF